MFTINEHHALLRLMRVSMGGVPDSKPIAHWLQQWDRMNDPASLTALQADLVFSRARDVEEITLAANRTGAKPSTLVAVNTKTSWRLLPAPTRCRARSMNDKRV